MNTKQITPNRPLEDNELLKMMAKNLPSAEEHDRKHRTRTAKLFENLERIANSLKLAITRNDRGRIARVEVYVREKNAMVAVKPVVIHDEMHFILRQRKAGREEVSIAASNVFPKINLIEE
jgi:hypothetical protein